MSVYQDIADVRAGLKIEQRESPYSDVGAVRDVMGSMEELTIRDTDIDLVLRAVIGRTPDEIARGL